MLHTPILIIGAGPFGLSLAAYLKEEGIEHISTGYSMDYWKSHMPKDMYLRSDSTWHLDANNEHTLLRYLETQNFKPADVEPLTLNFYLGYAEWFQQQKGISPLPAWVKKLDRANEGFTATLDNGEIIKAEKIVIAVGLRYFKNIPEPYPAMFPEGRSHHTAEIVDFTLLKNKRVLIIGGRQSAFEWAALIHEQGATEVHLTYRHATPKFSPSDWTWVNPMLDLVTENPGWFRNLAQDEKDAVAKRMWTEGRLKLEPWLAERIAKTTIHHHPHTHVVECRELSNNELAVKLQNDQPIITDHVILATGYKMDLSRIPFISEGKIAGGIDTNSGYPILDETFQSSIPHLYFTGLAAAQDFGPFFGFTAAVRASSKIIGRALKNEKE